MTDLQAKAIGVRAARAHYVRLALAKSQNSEIGIITDDEWNTKLISPRNLKLMKDGVVVSFGSEDVLFKMIDALNELGCRLID